MFNSGGFRSGTLWSPQASSWFSLSHNTSQTAQWKAQQTAADTLTDRLTATHTHTQDTGELERAIWSRQVQTRSLSIRQWQYYKLMTEKKHKGYYICLLVGSILRGCSKKSCGIMSCAELLQASQWASTGQAEVNFNAIINWSSNLCKRRQCNTKGEVLTPSHPFPTLTWCLFSSIINT